MLRKIFIAAFMMMLIAAQNVSAKEVLVHSDEDYSYYVIEESIVNRTEYRDNRTLDVTVKILYCDSSPREIDYSMWENDGIIWYANGYGNGMRNVTSERDPMAFVWKYCLNFLNIDYEVSYK